MSDKHKNKDSIEVSSDPLKAELVAIKDRLSAIETIQSISNAPAVKKYIEDEKLSAKSKEILKECEESRTRSHLRATFKFNSDQALYHHLKPLLEADLLRQKIQEDKTVLFEWSNLFRRLPKATIKSILGNS
jgi:DNA-binding transcriptional ArsR family regulator